MSGVQYPQTYFINPAFFSYSTRPSFIRSSQTDLDQQVGQLLCRCRRALSN